MSGARSAARVLHIGRGVTDHSPCEEPNHSAAAGAGERAAPRPTVALSRDDGSSRLLLIFTPSVQDPGFRRQKELLDEAGDGLAQRDVLVVEVIGADLVSAGGHTVAAEEAPRLRARWHADADVFTVVLASRDGTEKLRANQPMSGGPLFAVIDGSPAGPAVPANSPAMVITRGDGDGRHSG